MDARCIIGRDLKVAFISEVSIPSKPLHGVKYGYHNIGDVVYCVSERFVDFEGNCYPPSIETQKKIDELNLSTKEILEAQWKNH